MSTHARVATYQCAVGIGVYQSAPVGPDEFDCRMEWQRDCIGWCPT